MTAISTEQHRTAPISTEQHRTAPNSERLHVAPALAQLWRATYLARRPLLLVRADGAAAALHATRPLLLVRAVSAARVASRCSHERPAVYAPPCGGPCPTLGRRRSLFSDARCGRLSGLFRPLRGLLRFAGRHSGTLPSLRRKRSPAAESRRQLETSCTRLINHTCSETMFSPE